MDEKISQCNDSEKDQPPDSGLQNKTVSKKQKQNNLPPVNISSSNSKTSQKSFISSVDQLSALIDLDKVTQKTLNEVVKKYHMLITPYYFSLIKDANNENDPIRKQCVPAIEELFEGPSDKIDPLGEKETSVTSLLVHRYPDRALLIVTSRCFMYCRHCTRKRLWKANNVEPNLMEIKTALDYVRSTKAIRELIISGGDPLTLSPERLDWILTEVSSIPHIEVIRIGTRTPVVFPERINRTLCKILGAYNNLWVNVQFNHPDEITPEAAEACRKLQKCGIPVSNQSVLLKGINDSVEVMKELCHKLQAIRVRPYYLFQCDEVVGASHFRTSVFKGVELMENMRGHTSGMCIPTFVVDGPEGKGKIPIGPQYMISMTPKKLTLRNYENKVIEYDNPYSE